MSAAEVRVVDIQMPYPLRPWQAREWGRLQRFSLIVVHRQAGKTVVAVKRLATAALNTRKKNARYAYLAPYLKQARGIAWDYFREFARAIPGTKISESDLSIQFANGSVVRLFGADNADALRGFYLDGIVMDELADVDPPVWFEIVFPMLMSRGGWLLAMGTPKGAGLLAQLYYKGLEDPDWYVARLTVYDTGVYSADEIEAARKELTDQAFNQELLCDLNAGADDLLIPGELARNAAMRDIHPDAYNFAARVLGCDVARFGRDLSVILPRQGLVAFKPRVLKHRRTTEVGGVLIQMKRSWHPDAIFVDATGLGAGVVDYCISLGHHVVGVEFGGGPVPGPPKEPRFNNRRSQMWWRMAQWLAEGAIPNEERLIADLTAPRYWHDDKGRLCVESKDDMRDRGLPSTDYGDALAATFAEFVGPRRRADFPLLSDFTDARRNNPIERMERRLRGASRASYGTRTEGANAAARRAAA